MVRYSVIKRSDLKLGNEYFKKKNANGSDGPENFKSAGIYLDDNFMVNNTRFAQFDLYGTDETYIFDKICNDDRVPGVSSDDDYLNNCNKRGQPIFFFQKTIYI